MNRFIEYEKYILKVEEVIVKKFSKVHDNRRTFNIEALPRSVRLAIGSKFHHSTSLHGKTSIFIDSFIPSFLVFFLRREGNKNITLKNGRNSSFHGFMRSLSHEEGIKLCKQLIKYIKSDDGKFEKVLNTQEGKLFLNRWSSN